MGKCVLILDKNKHGEAEACEIVEGLNRMSGVAVMATSKSFIDVSLEPTASLSDLEHYAQSMGVTVNPVSRPERLDPIPVSRIMTELKH